CRHVEVGDQAQRPMTDVFILGALDQACLHRQSGGSALQRLYPGLLICTDDMPTLLVDGWCVLVDSTHRSHVVGKGCGVIGLGVEGAPPPAPRAYRPTVEVHLARKLAVIGASLHR